jgi:hypothetical protein
MWPYGMSSAFGATFGARRKYLSMSLGFADPARSRRKSSAARKEPTFSATAAAMARWNHFDAENFGIISAPKAEIQVYIWEQEDWPSMTWDRGQILELLSEVSREQGRLLGRLQDRLIV